MLEEENRRAEEQSEQCRREQETCQRLHLEEQKGASSILTMWWGEDWHTDSEEVEGSREVARRSSGQRGEHMRRAPHMDLPEEGWSHGDVEVERCEEQQLGGGAEVQRCNGEQDLRCRSPELWSLEEWYHEGRLVPLV